MATPRFIVRHPVETYYTMVFAISWGGILLVVGGPSGIPASGEQIQRLMPLTLMALFAGPSIAGVLMTGLISGRAGFRELVARLLRWRVGARWYAAALLPAPILVMMVLSTLSLRSSDFIPGIVTTDDKVLLVLFGLGWGLVGGGLLEETGWTGFAVPGLMRRHAALRTALIVGVLHGTWHVLIAFWAGGSFSGGQWSAYLLGILFFYFGALPAYRVLMVWVYERTDSLLVAMLMHASLSASTLILQPALTGTSFVLWNSAIAGTLWVVVAVVALASTRRLWPHPLRTRAA